MSLKHKASFIVVAWGLSWGVWATRGFGANGKIYTAKVRFDQHLGTPLPADAVVTDEYGEQKRLGDFFSGRPVIFVLSYYRCPSLCTLVLNGVVDGVKGEASGLGKDYDIITLSIDPQEKPPLAMAKKRAYLARLGLTETQSSVPWHFLTATQGEISRITDAAGFYYQRDQLSGEFMHPSGVLIATPKGVIAQYFFGIQYDPKKLRASLNTASAGRRGTNVDRILLYCFHYDPATSANGPAIIKSVRIAAVAGGATIVMLIAFLLRAQIREPNV